VQRVYKFLSRAASENKGDTPVTSTTGLSGMNQCLNLLSLLEGAIKSLADHRRLSASQLVWKAGRDSLSPLLKERWMVRSRFHPTVPTLTSALQAEKKSGATSQPFMTYIQDFILRHLVQDQTPDGLSPEQWAEMKDAAGAIAEIGDTRELTSRSNAEIDEYVLV
jgi:hypothetical protein